MIKTVKGCFVILSVATADLFCSSVNNSSPVPLRFARATLDLTPLRKRLQGAVYLKSRGLRENTKHEPEQQTSRSDKWTWHFKPKSFINDVSNSLHCTYQALRVTIIETNVSFFQVTHKILYLGCDVNFFFFFLLFLYLDMGGRSGNMFFKRAAENCLHCWNIEVQYQRGGNRCSCSVNLKRLSLSLSLFTTDTFSYVP